MPSEGMKASACPPAAMIEAHSTSAAKLPSGRASERKIRPAASTSGPATMSGFGPNRAISRGASTIIATMMNTVIGSNAAPEANAP